LNQSQKFYRYVFRLLPAILIIAMWLVFFWPMLCGNVIAGYRDSSYLYYPMFQWTDWQMSQGNFPLWMPYENTGFPLLADGTSSLLYPGKAIFWLRWLSFPARYGWYLALHVLLAATGSYWMAKTLGANRWGATLTAIGYAFGGSVLFQVCNVVYLVSAAWLPWALMYVWRMNHDSSRTESAVAGSTTRATLAASVCCSMMILGGDPQMVYHVGLIAAVTTVVSALKKLSKLRPKHRCKNGCRIFAFRSAKAALSSGAKDDQKLPVNAKTQSNPLLGLGNLVLLVTATSVLSAVQLLPTMEWAQYSDRAQSAVPMNIYHGDFKSLVDLPNQPPVSDIYQFSQEPWSMLGLIFPNVFGLDAPVNTRWSAALPGAERIWTPSNYFGCIVFLLAVSGFAFTTGTTNRKRKGEGRAARVWLTWIAVWFCVASFGWYGVNWLMGECGWSVGSQAPGTFRQPVGGLYWLMVTLLPKYCLFRYPAKLMVVGCLALCVLAGIRLKPSGVARMLLFSSITVGIGLIGVGILHVPQTIEFLNACQTSTLFGPFQFDQCWNTLMFSMLSTISVCGLLIVGIFIAGGRSSSYRTLFLALIVLTMIDMGVNNRWLLHPIDADVMTGVTRIEEQIKKRRDLSAARSFTVSVLQTDFHNRNFFEESSSDRLAELAMWRREMLLPKTHLLLDDVRLIGSFTSIWPTAFAQINDRTIATDVRIQNIEDSPRLESCWDTTQGGVAPTKPLVAEGLETDWRGQSLHLSIATEPNQPFLRELQLPILPMPGWRANFSSDENNVLQTVPLKAAGTLYSQIEVPKQLVSKSFEVRCDYFPDSFFGGGLISIAGWLSLISTLVLSKVRS